MKLFMTISLLVVAVAVQSVLSSSATPKTSTFAQVGLSVRNILDPNVITQNGTLTAANAAAIINFLLANNGNAITTKLNTHDSSSDDESQF